MPDEMDLALTPNAREVLARRYLKKDADGRPIERPRELLERVAHVVSEPDARYGQDPSQSRERFLQRMTRMELLPNSPTLMNAGRELGQLSACFALPVGDSIADIFDAVKWAATIQMTGGGTGFSFSQIRPAGDHVASTHGVASGPLSFIDVFDAATDAIKQGGTRRGANIGILRVDHPDVLDFITAKTALATRWRNFNISVAVTDSFMHAVRAGTDYALLNPRSGQAVRSLSARKIFDLMARMAWLSAEPGVLFIDRINASNPTPELGAMESTNPCAELPLLPFESCNLGSLNVSRFVIGGTIDYARLRPAVHDAIHFLDNVIDANRYPLPQIADITWANRKVGLGVMGWADALVMMGVPYDSTAAIERAEEVMQFIRKEAWAASAALAQQRGAFPNFSGSLWQQRGMAPVRNATVTAIAPTGTLSILAGCSSGIEPLYALAFRRNILEGRSLVEINAELIRVLEGLGLWSEGVQERIEKQGDLTGMTEIPQNVRQRFVTALHVAPEWHVRMQAAFQRHCDNAVSKTVNLPRQASVQDVASCYALAHELGCKGITVYRDGSRQEQVLSQGAGAGEGAVAVSADALSAPRGRCPDCQEEDVRRAAQCSYCPACGWAQCG